MIKEIWEWIKYPLIILQIYTIFAGGVIHYERKVKNTDWNEIIGTKYARRFNLAPQGLWVEVWHEKPYRFRPEDLEHYNRPNFDLSKPEPPY